MTVDDDVFEILDPEIDVSEVRRRVHDRLELRRAQAQAQGKDYFHLVDEPAQPMEVDIGEHELVAELQLLRQSGENLPQVPILTDYRLPLANALVNRLKGAFHALVLMYVNRLAARQVSVNRSVRRVLLGLASHRQSDAARIAELEREVAQLREQLARMRPGGAEEGSQ